MADILLGGNVTDPGIQIIGLVLEDVILVYKNLLLCVMYCWPFIFQLQLIL